MTQTRSDIKSARKGFPRECQKQALDAFVLPLEELGITEQSRKAYVKKAKEAVNRLDWETYTTTRKTFMVQAEELLRIRPMQPSERLEIRNRMYTRFMEGRIQVFQLREQEENCPLEPVPVGEQDFHNTEMALIFAHLPYRPEVSRWLREIEVSWDYEQLHMVTWFSSQLSLGSGKYSRSRPNHSAKVTYERLLNPYSLLWIAAALGEEKDLVLRTGHEMKEYATYSAKCGVVRRAIPWKRIYELAGPLSLAAGTGYGEGAGPVLQDPGGKTAR